MTTFSLSFGSIVATLLLLVIPICVLYALRIDMWRKSLRALMQMTAGLALAALLTLAAISIDSIPFTLLCVLAIIAAVAVWISMRSRMRQRRFVIPILLALVATVVPLSLYFVWLVLGIGQVLTPQYLIPIVALLAGGLAETDAKALAAYYDGLRHHAQLYYYLTANGATHAEAVAYFTRRTLRRSLLPMLQRMGAMTVGTAPVTLWVLTLCGHATMTALLVQIALVGLLATVAVTSLLLTLAIARRYAFDPYDHIHIDS